MKYNQELKTLINNAYHACRSAQSYGDSYHVRRAEDMLKQALEFFECECPPEGHTGGCPNDKLVQISKQFSGYSTETPKVKDDEVEELARKLWSVYFEGSHWKSIDYPSNSAQKISFERLAKYLIKNPITNGLVPLCGTEIYNKLWDMTEALELNLNRSKSNQETREARNSFCKRFCEWINQFGRKEVPSVEDIENTILNSVLADACVLEAYAGDVRTLAQSIHDLLKGKE